MPPTYTLSLPPRTLATADAEARPLLEQAAERLGFVPNIYTRMANRPVVLQTYLDDYARFRQGGGFTPEEQEVVFLVVSRLNGCDYCVAAHSMIGDQRSGVRPEVLDAARAGTPLPDPRLEALARFTAVMTETRGHPTPEDARAFLEAGFEEAHVLSIILAIAMKTISNYTKHVTQPELDTVFAAYRWPGAAQ